MPTYNHGAKWGEFVKVPEWLIGLTTSLVFGGVPIDLVPNLPLRFGPSSSPLPVLIFSHGLASWGSHYSTLLSHLANLGFVVAAVDHTDFSATASRGPNGCYDLLYESLAGRDERPFRAAQLQVRIKDVGAAFDFLKVLNGGLSDGTDKEECVNPTKASSPPSSSDATALSSSSLVALRSFAGKLDVARGFSVVGHSFGGGTAVGVASTHPSCVSAVGLDPWMFPPLDAGVLVPPPPPPRPSPPGGADLPLEPLPPLRPVPCCFITNDKGGISGGRHWRKNCAYIEDVLRSRHGGDDVDKASSSSSSSSSCTAVRFKGQDHIDVSDAKLLLPGNKSSDFCFLSNLRIIERFFRDVAAVELSGSALPHASEAERLEEEERTVRVAPW